MVPLLNLVVSLLQRRLSETEVSPELFWFAALLDRRDRRRCALVLLQFFEVGKRCFLVDLFVEVVHFGALPKPSAVFYLHNEKSSGIKHFSLAGRTSVPLLVEALDY
jgi:hypothetical protein